MRLTVERSFIRNIVNKENTHCPAVVGGSNCPKSLLAGGIPYLKLYSFSIEVYCSDLEVDANGRDEGWGEGVFAETEETARFTDTGISDKKELNLNSSRKGSTG